jgi:hypothetical protein
MVGYEMLGTPQRDIIPETVAQWLRDVSARHYLDLQPPPMPDEIGLTMSA